MKILFLDIDGVITSARANGFRDFDPFAVHCITWACKEAGYRIVLSSTWRFADYDVQDFWQEIFDGLFHDDWRTPDKTRKLENGIWIAKIRGDDVAAWLEKHPEVTEYIILDDDSDFLPEQKERVVFTDLHNGLLHHHFDTMRKLMKIPDNVWPRGEVRIHPLMFQINQYTKRQIS